MLYHRDQEHNLSLHWWSVADGKSHWFEKAAALHFAAHLPDTLSVCACSFLILSQGTTKGRSLGVLGGVPAFTLVTTSHAMKHVFWCFHTKLVAGIVVPSPLSSFSSYSIVLPTAGLQLPQEVGGGRWQRDTMVVVATFGRHRKESWSLLLSEADTLCAKKWSHSRTGCCWATDQCLVVLHCLVLHIYYSLTLTKPLRNRHHYYLLMLCGKMESLKS